MSETEKDHSNSNTGINRRKFIGALGAAAAAGAFLERGGGAPRPTTPKHTTS